MHADDDEDDDTKRVVLLSQICAMLKNTGRSIDFIATWFYDKKNSTHHTNWMNGEHLNKRDTKLAGEDLELWYEEEKRAAPSQSECCRSGHPLKWGTATQCDLTCDVCGDSIGTGGRLQCVRKAS